MNSFTVTIKTTQESKNYSFDLISDYHKFVYYVSVNGETVDILESESIEYSYVELARYINSKGKVTSITGGPNDNTYIEILKTHIRISRSMTVLDTFRY